MKTGLTTSLGPPIAVKSWRPGMGRQTGFLRKEKASGNSPAELQHKLMVDGLVGCSRGGLGLDAGLGAVWDTLSDVGATTSPLLLAMAGLTRQFAMVFGILRSLDSLTLKALSGEAMRSNMYCFCGCNIPAGLLRRG